MPDTQSIFQDFTNEWITREDGLPSHQIHDVLCLNKMLWMSTPNGLVVYDSEKVKVLNQKQGLLTHGIRTLTQDNNKILVCSDRGVDIIDSKTQQLLNQVSTVEQGLGWCQTAVKIASNRYLLACANGLRCWDVKDDSVTKLDSLLDKEFIISMAGYGSYINLILGKGSGLWLYSNGVLERYSPLNLADYGTIRAIIQQGPWVWLITDSVVVQRIKISCTRAES